MSITPSPMIILPTVCPLLLKKGITNKKIDFIKGDLRRKSSLRKIFEENKIEAVIHFAGLKAVGESVSKPIEYYTNNISGTLVLLDVMKKHGCKKIVFSSSQKRPG